MMRLDEGFRKIVIMIIDDLKRGKIRILLVY
jgi:hypothetical protein